MYNAKTRISLLAVLLAVVQKCRMSSFACWMFSALLIGGCYRGTCTSLFRCMLHNGHDTHWWQLLHQDKFRSSLTVPQQSWLLTCRAAKDHKRQQMWNSTYRWVMSIHAININIYMVLNGFCIHYHFSNCSNCCVVEGWPGSDHLVLLCRTTVLNCSLAQPQLMYE